MLFFSKALAIFFVVFVHNSYSDQKSQVVEYNIIQMLTQNLVEVGSVCGPGEKKNHNFFFIIYYKPFYAFDRFKLRNVYFSL
jgi:hypothetical protein